VIDAWVNAIIKSKTPSKVYNLGSGIKTTVQDLIKLLIEELKLRKDYPIEEMKTKKSDQFGLHSDIKRARLDLNYNPKVAIEEGVNKVVQYYK
jgi:UDP-glucose 4-epimerase